LTSLATELRRALEEIGFFFIVNHSMPQGLIDRTFAETACFHALPKAEKMKLAINGAHVGYMDNEGKLSRTSPCYTGTLKPNVGEAFGGVGPHTDSSFVTLLATSSVPGFQLVGRTGQWFPAPPIPGSILFNSGDMLTRWTNGRFRSTPHRVLNRSGRKRYSIPLFVA